MTTTEYMIKTLREYGAEHKNDIVRTFDINVSEMCFDVADRLEELAKGKHGRWEYVDEQYGAHVFECSECRDRIHTVSPNWLSKYCSNCGAKMDIKEE